MAKIIIASDHAGYRLKNKLKSYLEKKGLRITDAGAYSEESCDYPDFVLPVAEAVSRGEFLRGILICKSGIGSAIAANRFPSVRAALCYNARAARLSREHNDSNILVLGSAFVDARQSRVIVNSWLKAQFQKGRHLRRLNKIKKIEKTLRLRSC